MLYIFVCPGFAFIFLSLVVLSRFKERQELKRKTFAANNQLKPNSDNGEFTKKINVKVGFEKTKTADSMLLSFLQHKNEITFNILHISYKFKAWMMDI